jgi:hypothetical protein
MHPVRGFGQRPVNQPPDQTKLTHRRRGTRTIKRPRVEARSKRLDLGKNRIEHQFVLYRSGRRDAPKTSTFPGAFSSHDETGYNDETADAPISFVAIIGTQINNATSANNKTPTAPRRKAPLLPLANELSIVANPGIGGRWTVLPHARNITPERAICARDL